MNQRLLPQSLPLAAALLAAALALPALAQTPVAKPATAAPQAAKDANAPQTRTSSLPAKGLFVGDQLSESAKKQLTDLVVDALGLDVEVALMVPTGPWVIDGAGHTDRDLNDKRMAALRKFLTDRGVESKRIFVESRVDAKIKEPRLDVQLIGRPSNN